MVESDEVAIALIANGHGMRESPTRTKGARHDREESKPGVIDVKTRLAGDEAFLRELVRTAPQEVLEAEMSEVLGVERASGRRAGRATVWAITSGR
jgi:hypothetical protein